MACAFVSPVVVGAKSALLVASPCRSPSDRVGNGIGVTMSSVPSPGRRAFVVAAAALAVPALAGPPRARAGQRADLPMLKQKDKKAVVATISVGMEALRRLKGPVYQQGSAAGWDRAVLEFVSGPAKKMKPAIEKLSDSYVSEGSGIERTELRLKQVQTDMYNAFSELEKAAKAGDEAGSVATYSWAVGAANDYIFAANLKDVIAPLNPGG